MTIRACHLARWINPDTGRCEHTDHDAAHTPDTAAAVRADSVRTLVVRESGNRKLGVSAATYRTQESCPRSCPLYGTDCYARGRIFGIARKSGTVDTGDYAAVRALATLPADRLIRWNVSGDYLAADGRPDHAYIDATNAAAAGRPRGSVIAYTHAWRTLEPAMFGYVVNASCDTPADILEARARGWRTVAVVPREAIASSVGPSRIVPCVAQIRPEATCATCRLCAQDRPATVGFTVHGSSARRGADRAAARWYGPRDRIATIGPDGTVLYGPH